MITLCSTDWFPDPHLSAILESCWGYVAAVYEVSLLVVHPFVCNQILTQQI